MSDITDLPLQEENDNKPANYSGDDIKTLDWKEHIRLRPGMYIGKLGDGSQNDDGIYVLVKEVLDNAIDEFMMGFGKQIDVTVTETTVTVRDYGRGIPLDKVIDVSSKMNTGAKYDSKAFKKSVGLNGVGIKAVNALSTDFTITSARDGQARTIEYSCGNIISDGGIVDSDEPNGTRVCFTPDNTIFRDYRYHEEYIVQLVKNYTFLNTGLSIYLNGKRYYSRNGLLDLLKENLTTEPLYPIIHLKGDDIEAVITHTKQFGEEYYSFVNGQHTTQGGTHLTAFRESVSRTIKEYFGKNFEYSDIRGGMVAAISIKVEEPVFESQTKTKLGSRDMGPNGPTVAKFIGDFIKKELDNYLHIDLTTADILLKKIQENERERKAMAGVTKAVREKAKKFAIHNKKLLDCRTHLSDVKGDEDKKLASSIFITEGDSAAGSITKIRDVDTQAVFSLRGKPLNTYGMPLVDVYKNDEFALLRAALNIEESIDDLRYNKVIIATDADVDGAHICTLLLTLFYRFMPDLILQGHVYIAMPPLYKAMPSKGEEEYLYDDAALEKYRKTHKGNFTLQRYKGLGEMDADQLWETTLNPKTRMLKRVEIEDGRMASDTTELLMGSEVAPRRSFIYENAAYAELDF